MSKVKSVWIVVDCIANDIENIKKGEPEFLGYNFCVPVNRKNEFLEYIKYQLSEYNVPVMNIYFDEEVYVKEHQVDDEETIKDIIESEVKLFAYNKKDNVSNLRR